MAKENLTLKDVTQAEVMVGFLLALNVAARANIHLDKNSIATLSVISGKYMTDVHNKSGIFADDFGHMWLDKIMAATNNDTPLYVEDPEIERVFNLGTQPGDIQIG